MKGYRADIKIQNPNAFSQILISKLSIFFKGYKNRNINIVKIEKRLIKSGIGSHLSFLSNDSSLV